MNKILLVDDVPGWVRFHQNNIEYLNLPETEIETAIREVKEDILNLERIFKKDVTSIISSLRNKLELASQKDGISYLLNIVSKILPFFLILLKSITISEYFAFSNFSSFEL